MKTNKDFWFNNKPHTRFICIDNKKFTPHLINHIVCRECGNKVEKPQNSFMGQCSVCKTLISFFEPSPIQLAAMLNQSSILFNIGSYGSGKTTISCAILSSMIRRINNSRLICIAQTLQQLEKTAILELEKFFHPSEFKKKTQDYWIMNNGAIIDFWPSDDPEKLKSVNANFIWLVEATNYKMKRMYNEALSRIRNQLGFIYEYDENGEVVYEKTSNGQVKPKVVDTMNMILVEANPEDGSWTNHTAYSAHTIIHTPNVSGLEILKQQAKPIRTQNIFDEKETNVDLTCILNATVDNPLLPNDYFINLRARCNSQEDYDRIVYCDITSKKGLVFKELIANKSNYFMDNQSINIFDDNIVFVESFDPAGSRVNNDPEAYILAALYKKERRLVILDGYKMSGLNLTQSLNQIWAIRKKWGWDKRNHLLFVADNALGKTYKTNNRFSLKNDYELGLGIRIVLCDDKGIAQGIRQVKEWISNHAISFPNHFGELKSELFTYTTFEEAKVYKNGNEIRYKESFSEDNNHLIDALRYMVVMLEHYGYRQVELKQLQQIGDDVSTIATNNQNNFNLLQNKLFSILHKK